MNATSKNVILLAALLGSLAMSAIMLQSGSNDLAAAMANTEATIDRALAEFKQ